MQPWRSRGEPAPSFTIGCPQVITQMNSRFVLATRDDGLSKAVVWASPAKVGEPNSDGFVPFYCVELTSQSTREGAELTVGLLDERLRRYRIAPGVYRCKGQVLATAFDRVMHPYVAKATRNPNSVPGWIRWLAFALAMVLIAVQTLLTVWVTPYWLAVLTFRNQSGLRAATDTYFLYNIFDFRRTVRKLYFVWKAK